MKKLILSLITICSVFGAVAQEAVPATLSINKISQPCLVVEYDVDEKIVSDALSHKFDEAKMGRGDKVKGGIRKYAGVTFPELADNKMDIYTKVEGSKSGTKVYMAMSHGYTNFITESDEPNTIAAARNFLNSLVNHVNISKVTFDISEQEKVVSKAEKSEKSTVKSGKDLQSDLEKIQKDIETNEADQKEAASKLEAETKVLDELKAKLKSMQK